MEKKESFKEFARSHPELVKHIKDGSMSWQKYYEIYDIYGSEMSAWSEYLKEEESIASEEKTESKTDVVSSITDKLSSINMDSVQEHIKTAQKALGLVSELTNKGTVVAASKGPLTSRPINKFFED